MRTRQQASKELEKRGYKKDDEPGIWMSSEGARLAWFLALKKEDIEFDSKTWSDEVTRVKKKWLEKKRLAKSKSSTK